MKNIRVISILSLILAILSVFFASKFFEMAYWGSGMTWFWIGVSCDYLCITTAIVLVLIKKKKRKLNLTDVNIRALSIAITMLNLCWTTFALIAGLSGM